MGDGDFYCKEIEFFAKMVTLPQSVYQMKPGEGRATLQMKTKNLPN